MLLSLRTIGETSLTHARGNTPLHMQNEDHSGKRLRNLRELVKLFRSALEKCDRNKLPIGLQGFPRGACGDASLLLAKYLEENGEVGLTYVMGQNNAQTHGWLELDGIIVDITADQFDGVDDLVVANESTWHLQFEGQSKRAFIVDHDVNSSPSLSAAYDEIMDLLR
jgi:hypothetical protein